MSPMLLALSLLAAPEAAAPEAEATETAPVAETAAAEAAPATETAPATEATETGAATEAASETAVETAVETPPETAVETTEAVSEPTDDEVEAATPVDPDAPTLRGATERSGPPYYDEADVAALRNRYEVPDEQPLARKPARWRCLIADPTCGTTIEVAATAAYAFRAQQGDVSRGNVRKWSSGRAQYDLWLNLPTLTEQVRNVRYTKMTLGPKGGVIFSDTGDFWGNLGVAMRYWLGRGRFAPTIEMSSALSFKLGGRPTRNLGGAEPKFQTQRGPVGFAADVGFGLGGFGALVVGGQYDSPLAREDIPEQFRTSASGMFYIGFRGNILWGAPAGAAVLTHGLTQRLAERPAN